MQLFILKITLFLSVLMFIAIAMTPSYNELVINEYVKPIDELNEERPNVLILGDSHAAALRKKHLPPNVYNFSYGSDSVSDMYIKLNYFINKYGPPSAVIMECDRHIFSHYRTRYNNLYRSINYLDFKGYQDLYGFKPFTYFREKYIFKIIPLLKISNTQLLVRKIRNSSGGGKVSELKSWKSYSREEKENRVFWRLKTQFAQPFSPELANRFSKLVALCHEKKIKIIPIRYPVSPSYNKALESIQLEEIEQIYQKHDLIFDNLSDFYSEDKYFLNEDHISELGSELLCEYLAKYFQKN